MRLLQQGLDGAVHPSVIGSSPKVSASAPFLPGFLLELYGFWRLFSAFFPTVLSFLRRMPFLRGILDLPAFKGVRG